MFEMRTCYVNFAEHLQNAWNVNFLYEGAEGEWSKEDWRRFFRQIKSFGFTDFQCWIPPTLCKKGADRDRASGSLAGLIPLCHEEGLTFHVLMAANTVGAEWFFACPNLPRERHMILEFWSYYASLLRDADYFTVFPGDPGGCNRNGCDHKTCLRLAAEIAWMIKDNAPADWDKLHCMAQKVVEQADTYTGLRRKRWRLALKQGGRALLWSGGGAAVMWLAQRLI